MAVDRRKKLQNAERLLKQGKFEAALVDMEDLADSAPGDVLTMNRLGDLLARQGHRKEAIRFYGRIAQQFTKSGFLPKAIAIHKKILRLQPEFVGSLVALGDLYRMQKLPGEARSYLLKAADQHLKTAEFSRAREVYEKLVAAEPGDPRHRARLAEARAAEGEAPKAGDELVALGDSLLQSGNPVDAEKAFRRAAELVPDREEPVIGLARSLGAQDKREAALSELERGERRVGESPTLLGERVLLLETAGKSRDALELMKLPGAQQIPADTLGRIFRRHLEQDRIDEAWNQYGPVFDRWAESGRSEHVAEVYLLLAEIEDEGHIPALERLVTLQESAGADQAAVGQAVAALRSAFQAHSMEQEEKQLVERFGEIKTPPAPPAAAAARPAARPVASGAPPPSPPTPGTPDPGTGPPIEAEAPAVPLNRGDEEFVTGRLTQAEILEKYGLREQALQQLREVTAKFPGHVETQQRLVTLLREGAERDEIRDALVGLCLARRASGDPDGARKAATEANSIAPLAPAILQTLESLGVLTAGEPEPVAEPEAAQPVPAKTQPAVVDPDPEPEPEARQSGSASVPVAPAESAVTIDFDALEDEKPADTLVPVKAGADQRDRVFRKPGSDMIREIRELLAAGDVNGARQRLDALTLLGYASKEMESMRAEIAPAAPTVAPAAPTAMPEAPTAAPAVQAAAPEAPIEPAAAEVAPPVPSAAKTPPASPEVSESLAPPVDPPSPEIDRPAVAAADPEEDDDLSAITAALESELFADEAAESAPDPESEQSLEDVFAAFKEHVAQEVGDEDFRTHYDLGIAYKEMGLLDEAVAQFRQATGSPELGRESFAMLALCHREREDFDEAAECYNRAIESSNGDVISVCNLRYELAEVLLSRGDRDAALEQFRNLMEADPSFRDVRDRIAELESCST